ncbi:MAG: DUF5320 domain-containing protein [Candidatus Freyarchaeum deiterrae]
MCGPETGRHHGTKGMCGCQSYYLKPGFKGSIIMEDLTNEERIEILKDYKKILEKELESVNKEIKSLKEE